MSKTWRIVLGVGGGLLLLAWNAVIWFFVAAAMGPETYVVSGERMGDHRFYELLEKEWKRSTGRGSAEEAEKPEGGSPQASDVSGSES